MITLDLINGFILAPLLWGSIALTVIVLATRSRNAPASILHAAQFLTLCGVILFLPGISVPMLEWKVLPPTMTSLTHYSVFSTESSLVLVEFCVVIYAMVAALLIGRLLAGVMQAYRLLATAENLFNAEHHLQLDRLRGQLGIRRRVVLYYSSSVGSPVTFGCLKPYIVLPDSSVRWSPEMVEDFLLHELAHIRRNDWLTLVLVQFFCAIVWFLPLAYRLRNRVAWFAELAADDWVIARHGGSRLRYARHLLVASTFSNPPRGAVALIEQSSHYQRVAATLDGTRVRGMPSFAHYFYLLVIVLTLVLGASFRLTVSPVGERPFLLRLFAFSVPTQEDDANRTVPSALSIETPTRPALPELLPAPELPALNYVADPIDKRTILRESFDGSSIRVFPAHGRDLPLAPLFAIHKRVVPDYPITALRRAQEGTVTLTFDVHPGGYVENIQIVDSSYVDALDQAAIDAIHQYEFYSREFPSAGKVPVNITETFHFQLQEDAKRRRK